MMAIYLRTFLVWLIIIIVETVHGILRNLLLTPVAGDFRSRQIGVFIGILLIFIIACLSIKWIKPHTKFQLIIIGTTWTLLTFLFEISMGRIFGFSWERVLSDYNLLKGGLMPVGLTAMLIIPFAAAKIRKIID